MLNLLVTHGLFVKEHADLAEISLVALLCSEQLLDVCRKFGRAARRLLERTARFALHLLLSNHVLALLVLREQPSGALLKVVLWERRDTRASALQIERVPICCKVCPEQRTVWDFVLACETHDGLRAHYAGIRLDHPSFGSTTDGERLRLRHGDALLACVSKTALEEKALLNRHVAHAIAWLQSSLMRVRLFRRCHERRQQVCRQRLRIHGRAVCAPATQPDVWPGQHRSFPASSTLGLSEEFTWDSLCCWLRTPCAVRM